MIHKIFYAENQNISFNLPEQGSIGILLSGGADSSLLCYLLADTIVKNNLKTKIHPITAEMLLRPYCVTHASNVLKFISEKTGFHFENHLCFSVPNHNANLSEEARDKIYTKYTDDFAHRYQLQTVFHGNTANPPVSLVPDTVSSRRPNKRDDLAWRKSQEDTPGLSVPFIHIDKKEIAQIYKKYNLIESLLPLTRSCEGELEESSYFKKDCFSFREPGKECWWCREREYGFSDFDFKNNQNASAPSLQEGGTDLHKLDVYRIKEKIPILNEQYVEFNIPIAGSVGCDVSGGVDSALTCYLLAHTIMKYKLKTKVYPITGEILSRPYNLRFATNILNFITSTTGFKFSHHLSYFVPDHLENADQKELDRIEDFSINEFIYKYNLQTIFSGNIANPSTEKMPTSLYPDRPINRDNQDWKNSQLSNPNLEVPFINFDKKIIASLYKKFDLLDTLLPLTRSCESSPKESAFFTYDCFQTRVTESSLDKPCWGCQERAYGFRDIKRRTFLTEKIYYSENEFITLDIPEDGLIGCSMSGGSDSSLLCFLLAKTIKKYGLKTKIHPITAEILRRPYNLKFASNAVAMISQLTDFQFEIHLSYFVPNHSSELTDQQKDKIHSRYFMEFMDRFGSLPIFIGNTANPPLDMLPDTDYAERPKSRDSLEWRQAQLSNSDLRVPFIHIDKKVIASLYKKYNLLETLFPITRSCEGELEETAYFTQDCFTARPEKECWWCLERAYGFHDILKQERSIDRKDLLL